MQYYPCYLFDFDGTLVDSMPAYVQTMLRILDDEGISYGDDLIKTITPMGTMSTAKYYQKLGVNKTIEEIVSLMGKHLIEQYEKYIPAKAYVKEALLYLKEKGASLNVLTASPHVTLDPCLKRLGLYEQFDHVWSSDDFPYTKAEPEIYKAAATIMGYPVDRILFLDDNYHADMAAKKSGMKVCGVFDDSSAEFKEQMKEICDYYIEDFSQLTDF